MAAFPLEVSTAGERSFSVSLDDSVELPLPNKNGRLLVLLIDDKSSSLKRANPIDGPFSNDPQPIFGIDHRFEKGTEAVLDDTSDCFPIPPSQLPPGLYRAQARWDGSQSNSDWKREPGNLWSDVVAFEVSASKDAQQIRLVLKHAVKPMELSKSNRVEWFEMRSPLLSQFRGTDVTLRAGVVLPVNYSASRKYAAIYEVPGFGGDHSDAANSRRTNGSGVAASLAENTFRIVLDPEGPNGHTLFADSANNGPCGQALIEELIPAIEAKFPLISEPSARLLRGHSSGGWSTLWLATEYPKVFGACWSSAPDPVDFRRFQKVNIYEQPNFYTDADGKDLPSLRSKDRVQMTIRQESQGEDVLGPNNTSAQQWDSWFAVFGPKSQQGNPAALFDPKSGLIAPAVAESYRAFDIRLRLANQPERFLPIFQKNIRLICGTEDSYYLNEAVSLLAEELNRHPRIPTDRGYLKLVPGDHGSIFANPALQEIPGQMLEHLRSAGHLR